MIRNQNLLRLSVTLFLLGSLWILFQPRPHFVVPLSLLNVTRQRTVKSVTWLLLVCVSLLPLNIQRITGESTTSEKTLNIQLVYDVSLSMAAKDIAPSRFGAAKESMLSMIENLPGYNISIIAFAGQPLLQIPFSDETKALYSIFSETSFADFPPTPSFQGTAIGDALLLAIKNLGEEARYDNRSGIIVLLTDGDANVGAHPQNAINVASKLNIPIYTLGIGQEETVLGKLHNNQEVISSINIPLLKKISSDTGGEFYRVFTLQDFIDIFSTIEKEVKAQEKEVTTYETFKVNTLFLLIVIGGITFLGSIRGNFGKNKKTSKLK